ncbi:hypothetical protein [Rubrimonas cliftonensis]|uniref:Uncharacterized protein n=1 Tax=Rubrimonas cliftonensis TaxID=89524 RepID=A0A1H4ESQ4_9RHOB|nr:hypothetical protein [Rubrimonas cliftonensis]SEA87540.1 hypothetical protein SAMN05444370_11556 [Rubrimonas cliftonensis]
MTKNEARAHTALGATAPERWPWAPVPRRLEGRAVLGAFRNAPDDGDWTVLCDATDADDALVIGRWRPDAPESLAAVVRHASAFKAILAFETARLAAQQADAE